MGILLNFGTISKFFVFLCVLMFLIFFFFIIVFLNYDWLLYKKKITALMISPLLRWKYKIIEIECWKCSNYNFTIHTEEITAIIAWNWHYTHKFKVYIIIWTTVKSFVCFFVFFWWEIDCFILKFYEYNVKWNKTLLK